MFHNGHRVPVVSHKSGLQDLDTVELSPASQAALDAGLLTTVEEQDELDLEKLNNWQT